MLISVIFDNVLNNSVLLCLNLVLLIMMLIENEIFWYFLNNRTDRIRKQYFSLQVHIFKFEFADIKIKYLLIII